jgi:hypothetical protein
MMCQAAPANFRSPDAKSGGSSIQEFPSVRPVEMPDDDRSQKRGLKIPQVHSVASAGRGFNRLPMGDDAASLAPHIPQGSIAPNVAFRVLGVAFDDD